MKAVSGKMRERGREKKKTQKIVHPYQDIQTRHLEQHGKTRLQHPKFWLRGGQQVKLRHDLNGCPLHFWPSNEATVNSIHAGCIRCKQQQKLQSLSLIISEDHK